MNRSPFVIQYTLLSNKWGAIHFQPIGRFLYSESEDVFYLGNGFAALHEKSTGEKTIYLPTVLSVTNPKNGEREVTNKIRHTFKDMEKRRSIA